MAWDEWEQLKNQAAQKQSARMQLNQLPADGGGGSTPQGDLTVDQKDLAAIGDRAFKLWEDLGRYGRDAWSSSQTAASDLKTQGFTLGGAVDRVQSRWEEQLTSLLDACAHISNHMDFTKKVHQGDEYYIGGQISSISTLDKGFDGGKGH
ncbi:MULTISPECIES: hypothetical protein [Streptomyces]|uniref:Excreted virulence factor EspC, type VII ESX diderm n=2 Tax=Streptomyces TaxID=1883 RepID=A0ABU3UJF8_9ACTN|nr:MULTISPECIES: hypothetical protein [Streptomyces]KPI09326.1 hypothetical protein OK006_4885 [Actinobacteria bacterium OK006]KAF5994428.1 hypothetical protein BOG92_024240 [Streptomyces sp. WAC00263]MCX4612236.1 hypothetical protein [Streptomyces mirabilis]MCX5352461.1 hypothetical protein [Streptomyces mirabilis]MCZ1003257.1 hypothetical protein [Streptomyces mirabilis]